MVLLPGSELWNQHRRGLDLSSQGNIASELYQNTVTKGAVFLLIKYIRYFRTFTKTGYSNNNTNTASSTIYTTNESRTFSQNNCTDNPSLYIPSGLRPPSLPSCCLLFHILQPTELMWTRVILGVTSRSVTTSIFKSLLEGTSVIFFIVQRAT